MIVVFQPQHLVKFHGESHFGLQADAKPLIQRFKGFFNHQTSCFQTAACSTNRERFGCRVPDIANLLQSCVLFRAKKIHKVVGRLFQGKIRLCSLQPLQFNGQPGQFPDKDIYIYIYIYKEHIRGPVCIYDLKIPWNPRIDYLFIPAFLSSVSPAIFQGFIAARPKNIHGISGLTEYLYVYIYIYMYLLMKYNIPFSISLASYKKYIYFHPSISSQIEINNNFLWDS